MTDATFTQLKEFILSKNRYFNSGFANVHTDVFSGHVVSDNVNVEIIAGISDKFGNYFYIRTDSGLSYRQSREQISGCRNSQDVYIRGTLVAVLKKGRPKDLNFNLIHTLLKFQGDGGVTIQPVSSEIFADVVVSREYSFMEEKDREAVLQRVYLEKLCLVTIDFNLLYVLHPLGDECHKTPCEGC